MTYLRKEELRKISGATQRRRIIPWLESLGVPFFLDADNWPIVRESDLPIPSRTKQEPRINFA